MLAAVSGGVTSGLGYAIWYRALRGLTATQAAILQLSVPVIAAAGAVVVLHESVNPRLAVASVAVIGGVGLVLGMARARSDRSPCASWQTTYQRTRWRSYGRGAPTPTPTAPPRAGAPGTVSRDIVVVRQIRPPRRTTP